MSQRALRRSVSLGGQNFELIFSDEQAKVNVNTIHDQKGKRGSERILQELVRTGGARLQVRLRSTESRLHRLDPKRQPLPPFGSFGQVFADASPALLLEGSDIDDMPVANLTCWGDGRLNLRRASREALEAVCSPLLDRHSISQLLAIRTETPGISLSKALDRLELPAKDRDKLERLLTDRSASQSLWIAVRSGDRARHYLRVEDTGIRRGPRTVSITW